MRVPAPRRPGPGVAGDTLRRPLVEPHLVFSLAPCRASTASEGTAHRLPHAVPGAHIVVLLVGPVVVAMPGIV